jgi:hypothetical protein
MIYLLITALFVMAALLAAIDHLCRHHGGGPVLWRWFSGQPLDGKYRTNATWLRTATRVLHPTGHAVRWHHMPRISRAAIRTGGTLAPVAVLYGLWVNRPLTLAFVIFVFASSLVLGGWLAVRKITLARHRRRWVTPLHRALAPVLGVSLAERPQSWLSVEPDRSGVTIALPDHFASRPAQKAAVIDVVKAKLALEAPEVIWDERGHRPVARFRAQPAPPRKVGADLILPAIAESRATDLVLGLGRGSRTVSASLDDDSPHVMLSQGPGSGKSTTARLILAQQLAKGAVGMIWDYKRISLPWARGLPNVVYCKTAAEIHAGAIWLLHEIERRNEVADAGADIEGRVHAIVGPRIIVIAEEMNATMNRLRAYWNDVRESGDPARSPAVEAIEDASFMGRQVLCNIVFIGQKMSARASASGEARETMGIRVLGRYTASTWKMLVPEVPFAPSRNEQGRVQVVTGGAARETQVGFLTGHQARQLALSGAVTPWPSPIPGMPHLTRVVPVALGENPGPDQGSVTVTVLPQEPDCDAVKLSDAVDLGIVTLSLTAARKASHRPGFPQPVGWEGLARTYDPDELREWERTRPRALAREGLR